MYRRPLDFSRLAKEAVKVFIQPLRDMKTFPNQQIYADYIEYMRTFRRFSSEQLAKWQRAGLLQKRPCPLCESPDGEEYLETPDGNRYSKCSQCRFVFMNPAPTEDAYNTIYESGYEGLIEKWEQTKDRNNQSDFAIDNWFALDILKRYKPSGRFLDFGCGVGWTLRVASQHYDVTGVDINPDQLARAREHVPQAELHEVNIAEDLPPALLEKFDIIHTNQNLEHLLRPRTFVSQFHRMLRKDGLLFVSCPNVESFGFNVFGAQDHMATISHVSLFSLETMGNLLREEGFDVVEQGSYGMDVKAFEYWLYKLNPHPAVFEHYYMYTRHPWLTFLMGLPLWIATELYFYGQMLRMNERFGCYFYSLARKRT